MEMEKSLFWLSIQIFDSKQAPHQSHVLEVAHLATSLVKELLFLWAVHFLEVSLRCFHIKGWFSLLTTSLLVHRFHCKIMEALSTPPPYLSIAKVSTSIIWSGLLCPDLPGSLLVVSNKQLVVLSCLHAPHRCSFLPIPAGGRRWVEEVGGNHFQNLSIGWCEG